MFLYQYSDIIFEDNLENRAKFAALMLICVYLMNDKEAIKRRLKEVESYLSTPLPQEGQGKGSSSQLKESLPAIEGGDGGGSLDCYLLTALFIATHNPEYRRLAKAWRQSHPDCSLAIRRFQSIAKQIRC